MQPVIIPKQTDPPKKNFVAWGISFEEFLKQFDGVHAEWHNGNVEIVIANNAVH